MHIYIRKPSPSPMKPLMALSKEEMEEGETHLRGQAYDNTYVYLYIRIFMII
jgi:hypothetical protein